MKRGDKGSNVRTLQQQLKDAGFDPGPIDGIFGPKTEAALRAYQESSGIEVTGIADDATIAALTGAIETPAEESETSTASTPGEGDYTDDSLTRFNGLPGKPEIWKNEATGEMFAVYTVPGEDIPLLFSIPDEEVLATYFGDSTPVFDRVFATEGELLATGAVPFGDVASLKDQDGDPWAGFVERMNRAAEVMPWLEDEEVFGVIAGAYLEGRPVEDWELAATDWYQSRTEAERAWITEVAQDPATALQRQADNETFTFQLFADYGVDGLSAALVGFMAQQYTTGRWSEDKLREQVAVVTGSSEFGEMDAVLDEWMTSNEVDAGELNGTVGEDIARQLYAEWLGPLYSPTDAEVKKWAGLIRNDREGGVSRLTEALRGQRLALFPEYQDSSLTWNDIASPWRSLATTTWGVQPQDDDAAFVDIVRANNATEAQKQLRRLGVERGYERVLEEAARGLNSGMGRNVRGAV